MELKSTTQRQIISELNLIFMKSFLYSPSLPPFIVFNNIFNPIPNFCVFFNTSLFSSVEAKNKYLFQLFFQ